jgi:hypothetical protein
MEAVPHGGIEYYQSVHIASLLQSSPHTPAVVARSLSLSEDLFTFEHKGGFFPNFFKKIELH